MEKQLLLNEERTVAADDVLKLTALVYFQEALYEQEYESCAELLEAARKFGAQQDEIDEVITAYLRGEKPGGRNPKNRLKNRPSKKDKQ